MVLLTTIVMIVVLSLLVLSLMQAVFLHLKICNQIAKRHEDFYLLEAVANQLSLVKIDANCMTTTKDPNQVVEQLQHNRGCSFIENGHYFSYLINDLGVIPCLHIMSENESYSSHHWLLTVAAGALKQEILQLRIAKPVKIMTCKVTQIRHINRGIISWRYLPNIANVHG